MKSSLFYHTLKDYCTTRALQSTDLVSARGLQNLMRSISICTDDIGFEAKSETVACIWYDPNKYKICKQMLWTPRKKSPWWQILGLSRHQDQLESEWTWVFTLLHKNTIRHRMSDHVKGEFSKWAKECCIVPELKRPDTVSSCVRISSFGSSRPEVLTGFEAVSSRISLVSKTAVAWPRPTCNRLTGSAWSKTSDMVDKLSWGDAVCKWLFGCAWGSRSLVDAAGVFISSSELELELEELLLDSSAMLAKSWRSHPIVCSISNFENLGHDVNEVSECLLWV